MEKMSITRALAQLKLLDSRIRKEIAKARFVGIYQNRNKVIGGTNLSKGDFEKNALADKQSIDDLIERRRVIKSKILLSNAITKVTVAGNNYFVVEAIERKNSIEYEKELLTTMRAQYRDVMQEIQVNNTKLDEQIDQMVKTNLGADKQVTKNDYDNVANPIREQNELKLSDPVGLEKRVEQLDKQIDEFLSEVDFVLSESNSKTEIEV
jgi:hypothetical protein